MKKGFTLIELLAVLVILVIIMAIATPIILGIIDDAQKSANLSEVKFILDGAETYYATSHLEGITFDGETNLYSEIKTTSEKPDNGILKIKDNGQIYIAVYLDNVCYTKNFEDKEINEDNTIKTQEECVPNFNTAEYILSSEGMDVINAKNKITAPSVVEIDTGIHVTTDSLGESYYYRGAVNDNWLKFDDYYWNIIRINGDGTIRIIYAGTTPPTEAEQTGKIGVDTTIGTHSYNPNSTNSNILKYAYENVDGTITSSNLKIVLDNWYATNIIDSQEYIADSVFCSDSGQTSGTSLNQGWTYSTNDHQKFYEIYSKGYNLECNKESSYTVEESEYGNGLLTYPVGTYDFHEAVLSGSYHRQEGDSWPFISSNYLYNGLWNWTITTQGIGWGSSYGLATTSNEQIWATYTWKSYYVRPVISLKADVTLTGTGLYNDPYVVVK